MPIYVHSNHKYKIKPPLVVTDFIYVVRNSLCRKFNRKPPQTGGKRNGLTFLLIIYNIKHITHDKTLLMFEQVLDNDLLQQSDLLNDYLKCLLEIAYAPGNKPDAHTALLSGHISCTASSYFPRSSQLLTREQDSEQERTTHLPHRIITYKEKAVSKMSAGN